MYYHDFLNCYGSVLILSSNLYELPFMAESQCKMPAYGVCFTLSCGGTSEQGQEKFD